MESMPRILLISNSTVYGCDYLDHVEQQIKSFLGTARRVLFFPFALFNRDTYAAKVKARFAVMGYSIETAHAVSDPHQAIEQTDAIFIGGGNTFRLLKALQDLDLLDPIRQRVKAVSLTSAVAPAPTLLGRQSKPRRTCQLSSRARSIPWD